jgi:hypothetical protein
MTNPVTSPGIEPAAFRLVACPVSRNIWDMVIFIISITVCQIMQINIAQYKTEAGKKI